MEILAANAAGQVRRETMWGRKFLVAPSRLIVPGVLSGSRGALYYPPDEVRKSSHVDQWNGTPLVAYHPIVNGRHASARRPDVLRESGLGFVFNSNWRDALGAEAWFDVELTRAYDRRLPSDRKMLPRLERGEAIELSTGLFTDNVPAPAGATFNGRAYDFVAKNYRPDHLAVLPDQKGACSVLDGCGVLATRSAVRGATVNAAKGGDKSGGGRWITTDAGNRLYLSGGKLSTKPGGKSISSETGKSGNSPGRPVGLAGQLMDLALKRAKKARREKNEKLAKLYEAQAEKYRRGEHDVKTSTANVFCKTGKGGGIDPTCGKGKSKGKGKPTKKVSALEKKLTAAGANVKKIQVTLTKARAKVTELTAKLKGAKANVAAIKAEVRAKAGKPAVGKKVSDPAAGKAAAKSIKEYSDSLIVGDPQSKSFKVPSDTEIMTRVTAAIGKHNPIDVYAAMGFVGKPKSKADALKKIIGVVGDRVGAYWRASA